MKSDIIKEIIIDQTAIPNIPNIPYNIQEDILGLAKAIYISRLKTTMSSFNSPSDACEFAKLEIGLLEHEVFGAFYLNAQNRLICYEQAARGTLNACTVYPRELLKTALGHNAAAVIIIHNHPGGRAEPSEADNELTLKMAAAYNLVGIELHDHLVVSNDDVYSYSISKPYYLDHGNYHA